MTPFAEGAVLGAARDARAVDIAVLAAGGVLVLAPHPDDETLGCGAALAAAVAAGHTVRVIAATDGDGSHPGSARWLRERIGAHRACELAAALEVLGAGRVFLERLSCPDQGLPCVDTPDGRALVERLVTCVHGERPAHLWTTWEGDPHVDHRRCAALADAVVRAVNGTGSAKTLTRFPIWGRFVEFDHGDGAALAPEDELVRFAPGAMLKSAKARALECHATQMTALIDDDPDGFVMPRQMQSHFVDYDELFLRRLIA